MIAPYEKARQEGKLRAEIQLGCGMRLYVASAGDNVRLGFLTRSGREVSYPLDQGLARIVAEALTRGAP